MFGLLGRIRARLAGAAATSPTAVLPSAVKFRLRAVVAEHLGVAEDQLWPAASLAEDLGADSLDLVELAIAVETEFGIAIPEAAIGRVRTYGDLAQATVALACRKDAPSLGREVETASNGDGALAAVRHGPNGRPPDGPETVERLREIHERAEARVLQLSGQLRELRSMIGRQRALRSAMAGALADLQRTSKRHRRTI